MWSEGEGETVCLYFAHRTHYKEYLVDKINKNKLDPVTIYATEKIHFILIREELDFPPHEGEEQEETYRERMIKVSSIVMLSSMMRHGFPWVMH
jgi:hypothetical protein